MKIDDIPQLRSAPLEAKLELVEQLWAEIAAKSETVPLPDWHVHEIDRSLADYEVQPLKGTPWPELRDRLLNKK